MMASILRAEALDELKGVYREPASLFFTILMPVGFFLLFASLFGGEAGAAGGTSNGTQMLATFGTFGVLLVAMLNPGIGVAFDRERGWLRTKKATAVPLSITLAGKVIAAVPYAIGVLAAMTLATALMGNLDASAAVVARLIAVLVLGSMPFALLGVAIGFQASGNATSAILNALIFPMAIASGLWMPLEILPGFIQTIAPFLPAYHLSQLGLAQITGAAAWDHALVLMVMTVVMGGLAAMSYRRARL